MLTSIPGKGALKVDAAVEQSLTLRGLQMRRAPRTVTDKRLHTPAYYRRNFSCPRLGVSTTLRPGDCHGETVRRTHTRQKKLKRP